MVLERRLVAEPEREGEALSCEAGAGVLRVGGGGVVAGGGDVFGRVGGTGRVGVDGSF